MKLKIISILSLIAAGVFAQNDECWSTKLGFPCCQSKSTEVLYIEENFGYLFGYEEELCGITDAQLCPKGDEYKCCEKCNVYFIDDDGFWGTQHGEWCSIKHSCVDENKLVFKVDPAKFYTNTESSTTTTKVEEQTVPPFPGLNNGGQQDDEEPTEEPTVPPFPGLNNGGQQDDEEPTEEQTVPPFPGLNNGGQPEDEEPTENQGQGQGQGQGYPPQGQGQGQGQGYPPQGQGQGQGQGYPPQGQGQGQGQGYPPQGQGQGQGQGYPPQGQGQGQGQGYPPQGQGQGQDGYQDPYGQGFPPGFGPPPGPTEAITIDDLDPSFFEENGITVIVNENGEKQYIDSKGHQVYILEQERPPPQIVLGEPGEYCGGNGFPVICKYGYVCALDVDYKYHCLVDLDPDGTEQYINDVFKDTFPYGIPGFPHSTEPPQPDYADIIMQQQGQYGYPGYPPPPNGQGFPQQGQQQPFQLITSSSVIATTTTAATTTTTTIPTTTTTTTTKSTTTTTTKATTTTTTKTTTTTTKTTTTASPKPTNNEKCGGAYQCCGGSAFPDVPNCCQSGYVCYHNSESYYQCLPDYVVESM